MEAAILKIEKDFGRGAVMRLGDPNAMGNVTIIGVDEETTKMAIYSFFNKDATGSDNAKCKVQEEIKRYKYRMDREKTKYKVFFLCYP
ncbi:MAG: hypothetical protein ACI4S1_14340 [Roseburia sp.]